MIRSVVLVLVLLQLAVAASAQTTEPQTKWSVKYSRIYKDGQFFFIKGVCYSPVPIGASGEWTPALDFYTDPWVDPIAARDLGRIRDMGANALRTYATWPWVPTDKDVFRRALNKSLPEPRDHKKFLELCWNQGQKPLYVLFTLNYDAALMWPNKNLSKPDPAYRAWYLATVRHMARAYGKHPAVLGYCIGNEQDLDWTRGKPPFYALLQESARIVRQEAPNKIVTVALFDNKGNDAYMKELALFHAIGVNCYEGLGLVNPDGIFGRHRKVGRGKPLILTEWGENVLNNPNWNENVIHGIYKGMREFPEITSGGFYMEWTDEYWRGDEKVAEHTQKPGKWWGINAVTENGRPATDPFNKGAGPLKPDILEPRDTYQWLKKLYTLPDL